MDAQETANKQEATISNLGIETTIQNMSRGDKTPNNPGDVKFKVKYSKDYKGKKLMPEGEVIISKESADHFVSLGIGSIVEPKLVDK